MKTQCNFRLSEAALENLAVICHKTGANKTAVLEIALAELKARLIQDDLSIASQDDLSIVSQEFISTYRPPVGDPLEG